jgi:FdhD protein
MSELDKTLTADGAQAITETHYRGSQVEQRSALLADEVPIALEYNGVSHAVMLGTPLDLEDFAVGFSLTEGIIDEPGEVYGAEAHGGDRGITVSIEIASSCFARLKDRRRTLAGRTGCGICGTESLDQVIKPLPQLTGRGPNITPAILTRAMDGMVGLQRLQKRTGAVHGAGWSNFGGEVQFIREDVGRHNALDKLIGAICRKRLTPYEGFVVVTSRASIEMVQKAARVSTILAAVSAPTRLAAQIAEDCGLTLIGFARGQAFSVYTHGSRIATVPG